MIPSAGRWARVSAACAILRNFGCFHAGVTVTLTIGVLAWAIALWQRGVATTGDIVLITTLGFVILHATRDLAVALVDVTQHMARLSEAISNLLVPHEIADHPSALPLARHRGAVDFENVSFAYPDGRQVLDGFTLHFKAGQRTGLVGQSGAGKSTILALLQRFYDIQRGRILIDGQDIALKTQESLRDAMTIVPQDISLFHHRSILENIRYGSPGATDDQVLEAAAVARCLDFIQTLPDGIHTIVGERGVKLSGGQRQRIAIARALLKDAPILLLDEATSALDSDSEEEIRSALDHLMRGRTVIAIAHRLSTLRAFDRIVVLHQGKAVQDGPPDQLMQPRRALSRAGPAGGHPAGQAERVGTLARLIVGDGDRRRSGAGADAEHRCHAGKLSHRNVARDSMARGRALLCWPRFLANRSDLAMASSVEWTPLGRIERAWQLALEHDAALPHAGIGDRNRREQGFGIGMIRWGEDLCGGAHLHDLAEIHHHHPVGEVAHQR